MCGERGASELEKYKRTRVCMSVSIWDELGICPERVSVRAEGELW